MQTPFGHLTYCTNIHAGETWTEHFAALRNHIPGIKQRVCPHQLFGIGLRLSNAASLELIKEENLHAFQQWLQEEQCYVFTMNGFPYGGFHHTVVKDKVHVPDWTTIERVQYTIRLFQILVSLLPEGMEGGISTSPISYKHWHKGAKEQVTVAQKATHNILQVVEHLMEIRKTTGKLLHLDIEPEPDGHIGNGEEFLQWYRNHLLVFGIAHLTEQLNLTEEEAKAAIKQHVQLCYDVCHFAVEYEDHAAVIKQLQQQEIKVGKIQISAALKAMLHPERENRANVLHAFEPFNESTYLHQVVTRNQDGSLQHYKDLPEVFKNVYDPSVTEWRAHFHVPLFIENYGLLQSTQQDIQQVLAIQQHQPFTHHLEIETYTWEVLPEGLKIPLAESIIREVEWVKEQLRINDE